MSPGGTLSALADHYSGIAAKANDKLSQCNQDLTAAGNDLAKAKVAAAACLDAINQFEADLGVIEWGAMQPQIDDVLKALGKVQVLYSDMAQASDAASYIPAAKQMAAAQSDLHGAVNVLRSALGLPPIGP